MTMTEVDIEEFLEVEVPEVDNVSLSDFRFQYCAASEVDYDRMCIEAADEEKGIFDEE